MIIKKTREEIELMRESALIVSKTLGMIASEIKEGVTTLYLDKRAEEFIRDHGAVPSFLGLYGFPNSLCMSPNSQVVHGIPNNIPLKSGDVISVDCGAFKNGFHGDHAYSFEIGEVAEDVKKLLRVTKESLYVGIRELRAGNRVEDVGNAIQKYTESHGYGVVRELVGHGLGRSLHEDPQVPNYGKRGSGAKMKENLVLAIEPMINLGVKEVYTDEDGWTVRTADGKPSVHFEHDVCVKRNEALILSDFSIIEAAEKLNSNLNSSYY